MKTYKDYTYHRTDTTTTAAMGVRDNTIGERIRAARVAAGLLQREAGVALGYPLSSAQRTVARWEAGTRPVPRKHLIQLAELLKIPVSDLL